MRPDPPHASARCSAGRWTPASSCVGDPPASPCMQPTDQPIAISQTGRTSVVRPTIPLHALPSAATFFLPLVTGQPLRGIAFVLPCSAASAITARRSHFAPGTMGKLVVAVGSKNPVKVNSVRNAFAANFPGSDLEVVGYSVPSGVDDQPCGDVQTRQGALTVRRMPWARTASRMAAHRLTMRWAWRAASSKRSSASSTKARRASAPRTRRALPSWR